MSEIEESSDSIDAPETPHDAKKCKVSDEIYEVILDEAEIQLASYALELMSSTHGTRLFCLGLLLTDDKVTPWYFDACGAVCAGDSISMIDDFPKFAALVVALACLEPGRHGGLAASSPMIQRPATMIPPFPYPTLKGCTVLVERVPTGASDTRKGTVSVTLGDSIFTQYCLVGRRTFIYAADIDGAVGGETNAVIKFAYQPSSRQR